MYGMVNVAIEDFLCSEHGDAAWAEAKARTRTEVESFLMMEQYPDALSLDLIAAASGVTGKPTSELLDGLGEYWIDFAERSGYADLLAVLGNDLVESLQNLDNLHSRVGFAFPDLKPPSFWITERNGNSLVLNYQSSRVGLDPMIAGLVRGLAKRYRQTADIQQLDSPAHDHHRFRVVIS